MASSSTGLSSLGGGARVVFVGVVRQSVGGASLVLVGVASVCWLFEWRDFAVLCR